jgi:hypothetical protein
MQKEITGFEFGPLSFKLLPQETQISSLSELPHHLVATCEPGGENNRHKGEKDRDHYLHVSIDPELPQKEKIAAFRETNLMVELGSQIALAVGQKVTCVFPAPASSYYSHVYPDVKLGEMSAKKMKIFAKMNLTPMFTIRMYRMVHQNPLQYQPEICGIYRTVNETGIWALESKYRGLTCKLSVADKNQIAEELKAEFAARWPSYPMDFLVTSHSAAKAWYEEHHVKLPQHEEQVSA